MKIKWFACFLLLLTLLFCLHALAEDAIVYEDDRYIAFSEPYGYGLVNNGPACHAVVNGHTYYFLKTVKPETRADIIGKTEAALTALQAFGAQDAAYTIHVVRGAYEPRVDGTTLYIGTACYSSGAYVTGTAELCFGEGLPYGLLYGVSCEAAESLGWEAGAYVPLADALNAMTGDDRIYLDLNYACFIPPYTDDAMQANVRTVARAFAAFLTRGEKAALLTAYTDEAFADARSRFLVANGHAPYDGSELHGVAFHGGGDGSVRLRWDTVDARYVLDDGFEDFSRESIGESPLNGNYGGLRSRILQFREILRYLQADLSPLSVREAPTIWLETSSGVYKSGYNRLIAAAYYESGKNIIHLGTVDSLAHEYAHAMLDGYTTELVIEEALLYYYCNILLPDHVNPMFAYIADAVAANDNPEFAAFIEKLSTHLGHPVDFYDREDQLAIDDAQLVQSGMATRRTLFIDTMDNKHSGYDTAARYSFMHYLMGQHGRDAVIRAVAENAPAQLGGASWEALADQWSEHLNAAYGSMFAE